jgi:hypothetical protein
MLTRCQGMMILRRRRGRSFNKTAGRGSLSGGAGRHKHHEKNRFVMSLMLAKRFSRQLSAQNDILKTIGEIRAVGANYGQVAQHQL